MKVDISFVKDIHKSYLKQEIVKAMVNLGKSIGSHVIVEGVESREEYEKLKEIGVPYGQGYLFDVPSKELSPVKLDWR